MNLFFNLLIWADNHSWHAGELYVKDYADAKFGCVPVAFHLLCHYGGKFWVVQPRHPWFFSLRNVWRRWQGNTKCHFPHQRKQLSVLSDTMNRYRETVVQYFLTFSILILYPSFFALSILELWHIAYRARSHKIRHSSWSCACGDTNSSPTPWPISHQARRESGSIFFTLILCSWSMKPLRMWPFRESNDFKISFISSGRIYWIVWR